MCIDCRGAGPAAVQPGSSSPTFSQVFDQSTKKSHANSCPAILCCNVLVRKSFANKWCSLVQKDTDSGEAVLLGDLGLQKAAILYRPWAAGGSGPTEFASLDSSIQPMQADGNSSCQAHHTSQPAIIITDRLTSGPQ